MEIDYILEWDKQLIPIEVKWTENPVPQDARHLKTFLAEHSSHAAQGYVVVVASLPAEARAARGEG